MADDSVIVRLGGSIENLTAAVDAARGTFESIASPFTGLTSTGGRVRRGFRGGVRGPRAQGLRRIHGRPRHEDQPRIADFLGVSTEEIGGGADGLPAHFVFDGTPNRQSRSTRPEPLIYRFS